MRLLFLSLLSSLLFSSLFSSLVSSLVSLLFSSLVSSLLSSDLPENVQQLYKVPPALDRHDDRRCDPAPQEGEEFDVRPRTTEPSDDERKRIHASLANT
jgi:hypothetical protein